MSLKASAIALAFGILAVTCPRTDRPVQVDVAQAYGDAVDQGSAATFIVEFAADGAVLHRAIAPSRARHDVRPPRLVPGGPARRVLGHGEIVAAVLGPQGEFLSAIGVQGRPVDFLEALQPGDRNPTLGGRIVPRSPDIRRLVVPVSPGAASIVFYRVDVISPGGPPPRLAGGADISGTISLRDAIVGGDVTVASSDGAASYRLSPLGAWALGTDFSSPRIDIPHVSGAWTLNVPGMIKKLDLLRLANLSFIPNLYLELAPKISVNPAVHQLHASDPGMGLIADTYDIVIVSEGFQAVELSNFDTRAQEFVDEILGSPGWEPFKSRENVINVYTVALSSNDSGVEYCPSSAGCDDVVKCANEVDCPRSSWNDCATCWTACVATGAACYDCLCCSTPACVNSTCGGEPEPCRECGKCGADGAGSSTCTGAASGSCGASCDDECDDCHECFANCDDECAAYMDCSSWTVDPLDTWLEVEGNSDDRGGIVNFRAVDEARVWDAAQHAVPVDQIDLIIVMVNCVFYGGHANSTDPIAYVSYMHPDEATNANQLSSSGATMARYFTGLAVHESAHAMAALGEEYAVCGLRVPGVEYENHADAAARAGDHVETVWWADLAEASEMDGTMFKAVTDCEEGDAADPGFGLHWGAQFYDVTDVAGDGWYYGPCAGQDVRAACGSYRPTQSCTMNVWTEKPCRVCVHVLDQAIADAITLLIDVSAPPETPTGLIRIDTTP